GSMSTKTISANNVQKGTSIILEGVPCKVVDVEISKPGKHGHSKVRISAVGLIDEKKRIVVMPGHDNIEVPIIEKRTAQVLSLHGNSANVMDSETYETFDLKIPEEFKDQVVEGSSVLYWTILDEKIIKQVKGSD
ncbi:translation initiation factor IF-5A, partial [Candidatus Woesearchaeota archaeon]|nr:translation initiation factor IF-5A [Candidatus Woesearchaeota archaeon]